MHTLQIPNFNPLFCNRLVLGSTDTIPMEYSLVKPQDCKKLVGTQQNKHKPKLPSLWIIA